MAEATALGVAYMVGLQSGMHAGIDEIEASWRLEHRFSPEMSERQARSLHDGWIDAVNRVISE